MAKPQRETTQDSGLESLMIEEEIARRAYDLYLARGGEHSRDVEDWIEAESLVRSERLEKKTGTD
jgi:hypothetical protein